MAKNTNPVPVPGSTRAPVPGARAVRPTAPKERVEVTVRLRPRSSGRKLPTAEEIGALPPKERTYLSRQELESVRSADPKDIAKVKAFARQHRLKVVESDPARRSVLLSGSAADISAAFGVKLMHYESPQGPYRGRIGQVHVPADLAPIVEAVFGLDNRRQARPHFVNRSGTGSFVRAITPGGYTPLEVAQMYNFPTGLDGSGQCIGILEFGGGYSVKDLQAYFKSLGVPMPRITSVAVDGVGNTPDPNPDGPDGEVMLDIEVAAAIAPGARIVVYFAPFTEQGWVDALSTAVHDKKNKPSIISISWGFAEGQLIWTQQAIVAVNQALQAAALLGITVITAAGDDGSNDQVDDGHAHVDFPASSPYILGCGGTTLRGSGNRINSEVVWNNGPRTQPDGGATGGGISDSFAVPAWQQQVATPSVNPGHRKGRGVPDVAGNADELTGYKIRVHGKNGVTGGTSAVAPLWAGLIARINQSLGTPVGYFNPLLYQALGKGSAFRDITKGNNDTTGHIGGYPAGAGWDACTGWGSPNGVALQTAFAGSGSLKKAKRPRQARAREARHA
jgi:kumamolisin